MAKIKIDRKLVHEKYGKKCSYCGCDLQFKKMQIDHIKPQRMTWIKEDVMNHIDNLNPSCKRCNHYKRGNSLEGFRLLLKTMDERLAKMYVNKVALDYGIISLKKWDGIFWFEKFKNSTLTVG